MAFLLIKFSLISKKNAKMTCFCGQNSYESKNFSVEVDQNVFPVLNLVEMFLLGQTWSKDSSLVEHSRNIDSLSLVGEKISILGRDSRNITFFGGIDQNINRKHRTEFRTKVAQITLSLKSQKLQNIVFEFRKN